MDDTTAVADVPDTSDGEGSLADHESSFAPGAARTPEPAAEPVADADPEPEPEPAAATDRDASGRFTKPRHRAKSQQAGPADVPRIAELTRRLRETEQQLETERASRREPAREPAREPEQPPARAAAPTERFPEIDDWLKSHPDGTWNDYQDARADWRYEQRRAAERAADAEQAETRTYQEHVASYREKLEAEYALHPDFEDVVSPGGQSIQVSKAVERAVIEVGPAAAYYLATHPEDRDALSRDTLMDPATPGFRAVVAATKRYLSTLVASPQRPSSALRPAAAVPDRPLARVPSTAPKPPNPGRTSAMRGSDDLPSDESSLADHERAFGPKRRRA